MAEEKRAVAKFIQNELFVVKLGVAAGLMFFLVGMFLGVPLSATESFKRFTPATAALLGVQACVGIFGIGTIANVSLYIGKSVLKRRRNSPPTHNADPQ